MFYLYILQSETSSQLYVGQKIICKNICTDTMLTKTKQLKTGGLETWEAGFIN